MPDVFVPTPDQLALIRRENLAVNDDPRWVGDENFCVPAMLEKQQRLISEGIPLGATMPVTVDAGPRYGHQAHSLLRISGTTADGAPWVTYLDINQPFPLSTQDVADLGYVILET